MKAQPLIAKVIVLVLSCSTLACAISTRIPRPIQPPQPVYPTQVPVRIEPTAMPPQDVGIAPIAVFPLPVIAPAAPVPPDNVPVDHPVINTTTFTTTLHSGQLTKFVLGPCSVDGGYLVDVSPLEASTDGAHIEQQVLPEFDGEMWVDVLSLLLPEPAAPLKVQVELASTVGWPVAFKQTLTLNPGDWSGFIIQESSIAAGYVIEINPLSAGETGDRVEKALVQPEFPPSTWWDVLRLQILPAMPPLTADVLVYQTPTEAQVATSYELAAEPGVWYGVALGSASDRAVYIVDVTPLIYAEKQVERYTVQPEFDGRTWNDVVRVSISADRPPTTLQVTVYLVWGG